MKSFLRNNPGLAGSLGLALLSLLLHLTTYDKLGFHRDEFLYLALGQHPAAGYWSNPPLIGWISLLAQQLPFNALFSIRLVSALAGAYMVFMAALTARELGGKAYAQILASLIFSVSLIVLRGYSMLQPVPFDILFWSLILYWLLRYINTRKPLYLLLLGVGFGLGMLNKYMVVFLAAGIGLAVLFTPYRRLWLNRYAWVAVLIALVLFLPNLIWQYQHRFPVVNHMGELARTQLVNVKRLNVLIDQVLMFTFGSVLWVAGLIWLLRRPADGFRVFGFIYLAVLGIFLLLKGKDYYTAGLYPFLFSAGAVAWEQMIRKPAMRVAFAAVLLLLSLPMAPGGIPLAKAEKLAAYFSSIPSSTGIDALLRWEDGKTHPLPQDFADMLGWDELGKIVIAATDTIADKDRIMLYGENYGQAGAMDYYCRGHNLPPVASFSDSYLLWLPQSLPPNKDILVYVNDELGEDIDSLFASVTLVGQITHPLARERGTQVYFCSQPRGSFPEFWCSRVGQVRKLTSRQFAQKD
jgi:hypothetical protein